MDVIATKQGLYGGRLREVGERFTLAQAEDKGSWMAPVNSEDAEGVARQRTPIATPARAETGPNAALASQYAEAGLQTTALLVELQDLRVENGQLKSQVAEVEPLRNRVAELEALLAGKDVSPATVKKAEAAAEAAAGAARKDAAEQLQDAVEAANEARKDSNRSEDGDAVEAKADAEAAAAQPDDKVEDDDKPSDDTPRRRRRTA